MGVIILVLLQSLASALLTIFSRPLAVKLHQAQFQITAVIFTGFYLLSLPVAFLVSDVYVAELGRWLPNLLFVSVAFGLQNITIFWILRYMDAALATLMGTLGIISTVVMATLFLGEGLTLQQFAGAASIIAAISYVLSARVNAHERRNWTLGLLIALANAVFLGIGATGEKHLLGQMTFGSYLVWGWGLQLVTVLIVSFLYMPRNYGLVLRRSNAKLLLAATVMRTLGAMGFVVGLLVMGNLSQAIVLTGLKVIMVALLGVVVLHERQFIRRKLAAAVTAAAGVALMFW
jgi:drug/metabolite transporter (DMT)-like permease